MRIVKPQVNFNVWDIVTTRTLNIWKDLGLDYGKPCLFKLSMDIQVTIEN